MDIFNNFRQPRRNSWKSFRGITKLALVNTSKDIIYYIDLDLYQGDFIFENNTANYYVYVPVVTGLHVDEFFNSTIELKSGQYEFIAYYDPQDLLSFAKTFPVYTDQTYTGVDGLSFYFSNDSAAGFDDYSRQFTENAFREGLYLQASTQFGQLAINNKSSFAYKIADLKRSDIVAVKLRDTASLEYNTTGTIPITLEPCPIVPTYHIEEFIFSRLIQTELKYVAK